MVFRFSTPLAISVADFMFLGRQLPSPRAWASLGGLLVGAVGYALTDAAFEVKGCVAMRLHPHLQTTKRLRCTHLHISLFACLFVCLFACLLVCLLVCSSAHIFVCLFVCLFALLHTSF
jgi:hypothetical protein